MHWENLANTGFSVRSLLKVGGKSFGLGWDGKKHVPQVWLARTKVNTRVPSRHAPMVSICITKWISVRKLIPCQPFHPRQQENDHCLRQSLWLFQNLQFWPKNNFADYTMRTCLVTDKQTFFRAISLSYQSFLITVKKGYYLHPTLQKYHTSERQGCH